MESLFAFVVWSLVGLAQMTCVLAIGYLLLAFTLPGFGTLKQRWEWLVAAPFRRK